MKNTYSPEIRQRAVRLYQEQRSEYRGRLRKRNIQHAKPVAAAVAA